ncbi:MAG: TerB family tellurite resistance protein [archaeon]|nr:TerB family tellurite resistance protein [archaeon]
MFEFSKLCKECENMDPAVAADLFSQKSVEVISALSAISQDGATGLTAYLHFILCSIAADGKLAPEEFEMVAPLLEKIVGKPITYDEAKQIFVAAGLDRPKEYKAAIDYMVDLVGTVSVDLKMDIVTICLLVCAMDGKVSHKERKWIKQLLA